MARNTTDEAAAAEAAAEEEAGPMGVGLTRLVPGRTARDVELGAGGVHTKLTTSPTTC